MGGFPGALAPPSFCEGLINAGRVLVWLCLIPAAGTAPMAGGGFGWREGTVLARMLDGGWSLGNLCKLWR